MRLFLAIELPEEVRQHLATWGPSYVPVVHTYLKQRQIDARLSVTPPQNLHVTLKFLGEVEESAVKPLCDALGSVPVEAASPVRAGHLELLPQRGPVRVVAAGLDGDVGRLERLYRAVEDACERERFAPERRPYLPHVTLARARDPLPGERRDRLREMLDRGFPGPNFEVRGFTLFESRLGAGPPQYIPLGRFGA
jgi:RNA 2',3'-cyclic 3'-phosphodiesterase